METYARAVPVSAGPSEELTMALASQDVGGDPAEVVARIAAARRARLLRVHRRRLRFEDLEDCYSQATLELVARSRRAPFVSQQHVLNALEQKFLSRIEDRRRAIGGRSAIEAAIARAAPVDVSEHGVGELEDRSAAVEEQVIARTELRQLREVIADLSRDQQLVLASQVCVDMGVSEFCARYGWSVEKYRKVAQRARGKLRVLVEEYARGERCRRLEPDLLAMCAGVAQGESLARARAHVANCMPCARMVGELDRAAHSVAALLPPAGALAGAGGLTLKLAAVCTAVRRAAAVVRHPVAEVGAGSSAGVAGGTMASMSALKVGLAAVCIAGAAGSYAVCARFGVLPSVGLLHSAPVHHAPARLRVPSRRDSRTLEASKVRSDAIRSTAAATARVRVVRHTRRAHLTTIAQIRREFGLPPARVASSGIGASPGVSPGQGASGGGVREASRENREQVSQTQAEFGFEK